MSATRFASVIVPALILSVGSFYFHDAYYRGLIGHVQVFDHALPQARIAEFAK